MSFVQPQTNPARHSVGIGVAIVFHIALIWALMNGLASKVMTVINAPIETKIIEEVKPPPPPINSMPLSTRPALTSAWPVFHQGLGVAADHFGVECLLVLESMALPRAGSSGPTTPDCTWGRPT